MRYRITACAEVRYAFWPAAPQRHVGHLLRPGEILELPNAKAYRDLRMVRVVDGPAAAVTVEEFV